MTPRSTPAYEPITPAPGEPAGGTRPTPATPTPTTSPADSEFAIRADRRSVRRAVRGGFRVRTRCAGGCVGLAVRVYLDRRTAKRLKLSKGLRSLLVARAPSLRSGTGRRIHRARFTSARVRRVLARRKRLTLRVVSSARYGDGKIRRASQRISLRR